MLQLFDSLIGLMASAINFFYTYTGNYGWAIVALTLVIRFLILPLTVVQFRSMRKMQELQPETKKLQEEYEDDREKLNEEMMKLWQEHGVNPLGGCLPLVVQMPILYGLFRAIEAFPALQGASFLWVTDLAGVSTIDQPLTYLLPLLAAATTFLQTKVMNPSAAGGGNPMMQKSMSVVMPAFIGFIATRFPAGLAVYWVASNTFAIIQSYFIYRDSPASAEEAKGEEG